MFLLDRIEAASQVRGLADSARKVGADVVLLQNVPAILAAALLDIVKIDGDLPARFGVVVSVPGPRLAGVSREFQLFCNWVAKRAAEAIKFANTRATVSVNGATLTVTVDPVPAFQFDHIEWLS